jgi:hypothetical protein
MTIQRLYNLPNCKLVLQGLSEGANTSLSDVRPPLSMLMSAECLFDGENQSVSGGREFFESFVKTVSHYAQEFLSGIPVSASNQNGIVKLEKTHEGLHRLTVFDEANPASQNITRQLDLTTVQLFDLVEAIDQFFADPRTLPELSLQLQPISKRDVPNTKPVGERVVPAVVGLASLAIAALGFYNSPVPNIVRPRTATGEISNTTATPSPGATPAAGNSPIPTTTSSPNSSPNISPNSSPNSSPNVNSTATSTATITPEAVTPSPTTSELPTENLTNAVKISDPIEVQELLDKTYNQLDKGWTKTPEFQVDLVYRVSVGKDGAIIGYKPINAEASDQVNQIPLPDLLYQPADSRTPNEPLADFKVVFTPSGVLQVSPW